jgi:hypothetical protein
MLPDFRLRWKLLEDIFRLCIGWPVRGRRLRLEPAREMKRAPLGARREMTDSPSHRPNRLESEFQSELHHALAS